METCANSTEIYECFDERPRNILLNISGCRRDSTKPLFAEETVFSNRLVFQVAVGLEFPPVLALLARTLFFCLQLYQIY